MYIYTIYISTGFLLSSLRGGDSSFKGVEKLVFRGGVEFSLPHQPFVVLKQLLFLL